MSRVARILDRRPNGPLSQISLYRFRCTILSFSIRKLFLLNARPPFKRIDLNRLKLIVEELPTLAFRGNLLLLYSHLGFPLKFHSKKCELIEGTVKAVKSRHRSRKKYVCQSRVATIARAMREGKEGKERDSRNRMSQMNAKILLAIIINMKQKKMFVRYGSKI